MLMKTLTILFNTDIIGNIYYKNFELSNADFKPATNIQNSDNNIFGKMILLSSFPLMSKSIYQTYFNAHFKAHQKQAQLICYFGLIIIA